MGNRAHIIFTSKWESGEVEISPAVYLHWNGGPESVYAFLQELRTRMQGRADASYAAARFAGIVGEFFGPGDTSLGVTNGPATLSLEALKPFDHGDNGIYIVNLSEPDYQPDGCAAPNYKVNRARNDWYSKVNAFGNIKFLAWPHIINERKKAERDSTYAGICTRLAAIRAMLTEAQDRINAPAMSSDARKLYRIAAILAECDR